MYPSEHGTTLQRPGRRLPATHSRDHIDGRNSYFSLYGTALAQREFVTGHILLSGHHLLLLEFIFSFIDLRYIYCSYAEKKKQIYTSVSQILGPDSSKDPPVEDETKG